MTKSVELAQLGGIVTVSGSDVSIPLNFKVDVPGGTGVHRAVGNSAVTAYMFGSSGGSIVGIGSETNHPVAFYVNNAEKARLDANGRWQLACTAGSYRINIADPSNAFAGFYAASFSPFVVGQDSNGDTFVQNNANGTLRLGANATEYLRIDPAAPSITVRQPAGLGYGSGSGGTVTQTTSKGTGVTLNKPSGTITMNAASLAANGVVSFFLTNSTISSTDVVIVNVIGAASGLQNYQVWASTGSGGAYILLRNISAGALAEAVTLNFAVIKGATS